MAEKGTTNGNVNHAHDDRSSTHIPLYRQVWDATGLTSSVINHPYAGSGTLQDPFIVTWLPDTHDPRNPMLWPATTRWGILMVVAMCALMVSLCSSAYSGAPKEVMAEFGVGEEVYTLGISLFVVGFAVGPVIWAPLSELFGRRPIFIITYVALTAFNAGAAGARNIWTLLILRFFAGAIGSNSLVSSGAVVADQFSARERGLALSYYSVTPFLGPTLGPIIGGYIGQDLGWRWIEGFLAVFTGTLATIYIFTVPETYAPRILHNRAVALSKMHGAVYRTQMEVKQGRKKLLPMLKVSLSRPWVLVAVEPIVLIFSVYQAIIYATLYMCFAAFPIVYQEQRGWTSGQGGLAFLGVTVGMVFTVPYNIWTNKRYAKLNDQYLGFAPPEARLPLCMAGAIAAPIGFFWFAWTNGLSIHWIVSIMAGAPFGFALCVIFQGTSNYLVDSYTVYAASVLAGTAIIRSVLAAAFPLFTAKMYASLGLHWAASVPAFLALVFAPFPFILYKYGAKVRERCKYSAEAIIFMKELQGQGPRGSR